MTNNLKSGFASIMVLGVIVVALVATVLLVGRSTNIGRSRAESCDSYNFSVARNGIVTARNDTTSTPVPQTVVIYINGTKVSTLPVPAIAPGQTVTLGTVTVPTSGDFSWRAVGSLHCDVSGENHPPCNYVELRVTQ